MTGLRLIACICLLVVLAGGGRAAPCRVLALFGIEVHRHATHLPTPAGWVAAQDPHHGCDCCAKPLRLVRPSEPFATPGPNLQLALLPCLPVPTFQEGRLWRLAPAAPKPPPPVPRIPSPPVTGRFLI